MLPLIFPPTSHVDGALFSLFGLFGNIGKKLSFVDGGTLIPVDFLPHFLFTQACTVGAALFRFLERYSWCCFVKFVWNDRISTWLFCR